MFHSPNDSISLESEAKIKTLVTDATLLINNKGINSYPITSYYRFIITSNNEDPIKTTHDDRRNFIMRSSDELIGNMEYFNHMYQLLDDENAENILSERHERIKRFTD